jgi:hypothetical protein
MLPRNVSCLTQKLPLALGLVAAAAFAVVVTLLLRAGDGAVPVRASVLGATETPTDTPTDLSGGDIVLGSTSTPTDTPAATDTPTATSTATDTSTPAPTDTPTPSPTDTPTPLPTDTPSPTDTPAPPSATPTDTAPPPTTVTPQSTSTIPATVEAPTSAPPATSTPTAAQLTTATPTDDHGGDIGAEGAEPPASDAGADALPSAGSGSAAHEQPILAGLLALALGVTALLLARVALGLRL